MRYERHDPERELDQEWRYCCICGLNWVYYEMDFENASVEPTVGETLTGATSGKTATVSVVTLDHGTYLAGTATGTIRLTSPSGDFTTAEAINGSTGGDAMITCRAYVPRRYGRTYPESSLVTHHGKDYCVPHFRAYSAKIRDDQVNIPQGDE